MITFRPALPSDLQLLLHWDSQRHVIESDPNDDWNWEGELQRNPPWREQLIAELGGRPIGFVQIIDPALEETGYWGAAGPGFRAIDIWIGEASDLGKGHGTTIMKLAISRCFEQSAVRAILIDPLASNTRAHRFYERLGFQFQESRIFGDDECHVYCLSRENWSARHNHEHHIHRNHNRRSSPH